MEVAKKIVRGLIIGLSDFMAGPWRLMSLWRKDGFKDLMKSLLNIIGMNGIGLLSTHYIFYTVVLPFIQAGLLWIGIAYVGEYLAPGLIVAFSMCWTLPLFLLSRFFNMFVYQSIAEKTFKLAHGRRNEGDPCYILADQTASFLVQSLFALQTSLISFFPIPVIREILLFVHLSILNSFYAFDYKWSFQGAPLHKRIDAMECFWPYFLGFGSPLAFVTMMIDTYIYGICVYSMIFPLLVIGCTLCNPCVGKTFRLPIFCVVNYLTRFIVGNFLKRKGK